MFSISDINDDGDILKCVISGCNSSVVNAIRRIILSEVETVSFNTTDYQTSDLIVIKNASSLHNEFLLHRIGLIPINIPDISSFNPDKYKFILKKQNNDNGTVDVTTSDFVVKNLETGKDEDTSVFFPPNKITGDNILITILKSNPTGDGEIIHIEGKCSIGSGNDNSRFSPVSNVVFINKRDEVKAKQAFTDKINSMDHKPTDTELITLTRKFELEEADRHFIVDENGSPNVFDFTIETVGVISPTNIMKLAIKKLIDKLNLFVRNLALALDSKNSDVSIRDSESLMDGFDITIEQETHTLGFLLQTYINKLNKNTFIGYMNPHPLEKKIKIRINITDINQLKTVIETTVSYLVDALNNILSKLN